MTLQSLRQFTSQPQSCRAFGTSVVARQGTRTFTLPPSKLRALITLYHNSSSYVTPANLSSRIDKAFTGSVVNTASFSYMGYQTLQNHVMHNRDKTNPPPLLYKSVPLNRFNSTTWSGMIRGERQALISATLWGIQVGGKPLLETVQESSATNEELGNLLDQTVHVHRL